MMHPYYDTPSAQLWHGDCLAVLPLLPAASVDLILADLPYGTTACAWDSIIPLDTLWAEYRRVLKPHGVVVLFGSQPFTSLLIASNLAWFRYAWVWDKGTAPNFQLANKQPLKGHEDIAVFCADSAPYYPQMTPKAEVIDKRNWTVQPKRSGALHHLNSKSLEIQRRILTESYPTSVLRFSACAAECNGAHRLHPTQKPVALGAYFVRTYSNPGDLVLDNTMGVGSFGVAAVEEGRRFIGIERAPDPTTADDYCGIARERILATQAARGQAVPVAEARRPVQIGMALA